MNLSTGRAHRAPLGKEKHGPKINNAASHIKFSEKELF
jgi:hypothetical protein